MRRSLSSYYKYVLNVQDTKKNMDKMQRATEDTKQKWMGLLEVKYTTPKRKILLERIIQIRCCSRKEQGIGRKQMTPSKRKHKKEKKMTDNGHRAPLARGIISSGLTYVAGVPEREERKAITEKYKFEVRSQIFQIWWKLQTYKYKKLNKPK